MIELLVVIAIIGILASVVLASLNSARNKGADAAAKSNLNNARPQFELYYDNNSNSYASACTGDSTIAAAITAAGNATGNTAVCASDDDEWVAEIELKAGTFYCVDYTGTATTAGSTVSGTSDTNIDCTN